MLSFSKEAFIELGSMIILTWVIEIKDNYTVLVHERMSKNILFGQRVLSRTRNLKV